MVNYFLKIHNTLSLPPTFTISLCLQKGFSLATLNSHTSLRLFRLINIENISWFSIMCHISLTVPSWISTWLSYLIMQWHPCISNITSLLDFLISLAFCLSSYLPMLTKYGINSLTSNPFTLMKWNEILKGLYTLTLVISIIYIAKFYL